MAHSLRYLFHHHDFDNLFSSSSDDEHSESDDERETGNLPLSRVPASLSSVIARDNGRIRARIVSSTWRKPEGLSARDACRVVPLDRWDVRGVPAPERFGAFISRPDMFDARLFSVGSKEADFMDPQQRVLLECVYEATSPTAAACDVSSCAVAVGVSYNEYFLSLLNLERNGLMATSGTLSVLSGRVSYTFDLKGPAKSIDTACSSSLIGVHVSVTSSMANGSEYALACGINLLMRRETSWVLSGASMLAADGRCKTLDSRADGYGRAEGCVVHLLTSRVDAMSADEVSPVVVISGSAALQDGRSSSLTAPNGPAQQQVVRAALRAARLSSDAIHVVEMHGTGTALGDPIEIGALGAVFGSGDRAPRVPLRLQASKATVLHAEPCAGAVGLLNSMAAITSAPSMRVLSGLRDINPYVGRALEGAGGTSGFSQRHVLRAEAACTSVRAACTSSFAS